MRKLFRDSVVLAIALFVATLNANGQIGVPRFNDYPASERFNGRTAPLVLTRAAREFRTRLREAGCWSPGSGVDENFKPVEFRLNSALIVLSGERNEKEGDYATRYYRFQRNRLVLLKTTPH